jgi:hypothetical protein
MPPKCAYGRGSVASLPLPTRALSVHRERRIDVCRQAMDRRAERQNLVPCATRGHQRNRRRTLVWFNLRTGLQQPRHPVHYQMRDPAASICIGTLSHAERNIRGTVSKEQDAGSAGQVTLVLRSVSMSRWRTHNAQSIGAPAMRDVIAAFLFAPSPAISMPRFGYT